MDSKLRPFSLEELATAYTSRHVRVNPEYQRGTKWTPKQKQLLIDSILRGFTLPLFYIHLKKNHNAFTGTDETHAWLVDGQQRLAAITGFMQGEFALPDPSKAASGSILPYQLMNPPPWAGKKFNELDAEERERFLSHKMSVVQMEEERPDEVRDLFIRLQAGTPLTAQEKRDAWPGNFSVFVIRNAGKVGHPESNPHRFFDLIKLWGRQTVTMDDGDHYVDRRANMRKFFAGLAMTVILREETDDDFVDLKGQNINDFYLKKADLNERSPAIKRLQAIMNTIVQLPNIGLVRDGNKLTYQMAFHLALIVDSFLQGNYVSNSWRDALIPAFEGFRESLANARERYRNENITTPHHEKFVQKLSGSGSDTALVIRQRHRFLLNDVYQNILPKPIDPQRLFGPIEREAIWYRDGGRCKHPNCNEWIPFKRIQIHHIKEHSEGGATILDNGILVCDSCHSDRAGMRELDSHFRQHIATVKNPEENAVVRREDEVDAESANERGRLKITINWESLGFEVDGPEVIQETTESKTVQILCKRLIDVCGDDLKDKLTNNRVLRYPLSSAPKQDFVNANTGRVYNSLPIPGTDLFVCTQAGGEEKVRRLRQLINGLFPGNEGAVIVER